MAFGTQPDDGANVPISTVYSKENNSFPALQAEPGAYKDSNSNQSSAAVMSFLHPLIVQKNHSVTGSGAKTLTCAFSSNNIAGNSIIVALGMGEVDNGSTITLAVTDTNSNAYLRAASASQSTTLEAAIFYVNNIAAGANTVTVTIAGGSSSNTAIAVEIYEVWGLIAPTAVDQTATGNNAGSTSPATGAVVPAVPNEIIVAAISAAGGTITSGTNWTLDSTSLAPTGGNLVSFGVESQLLDTFSSITPSATLSASNAWAMVAASFKTVVVPVQGAVNVSGFGGASIVTGTGASGSGVPRVTVSNDSTVGSNSATGAAVPANAFYGGGVASTSLPSAATAGNLTGEMVDKFGRQVVLVGAMRDLVGSQTTTISSTTETTIVTATASVFHDLTAITCSNTSATAVRVDFRDTTAGSVIFQLYVPAGDVRGIVFSTPQPQTSVNTAWTATLSSAVTDIRVFCQFLSNK